MAFKLKTSLESKKIFEIINKSTGLQPFALVKVAISLSIKQCGKLEKSDFETPNDGLELNRQTITGEYDKIFSSLIVLCEREAISDDILFPKYYKAHIDRGSKLLLSEFRYSKGNFYTHLCELDKGI